MQSRSSTECTVTMPRNISLALTCSNQRCHLSAFRSLRRFISRAKAKSVGFPSAPRRLSDPLLFSRSGTASLENTLGLGRFLKPGSAPPEFFASTAAAVAPSSRLTKQSLTPENPIVDTKPEYPAGPDPGPIEWGIPLGTTTGLVFFTRQQARPVPIQLPDPRRSRKQIAHSSAVMPWHFPNPSA